MFTDYLSTPMIPTPMQGWPHILHVPTRTAVIPGDGTTAIVYTHTQDVGKFTAALLNVPVWDKEYHLVGELTTFNDVVKAAESVTGKENIIYFNHGLCSILKCCQNKLTDLRREI